MNINDSHIQEIGNLILQCKKVVENEWQELSFVFDVTDGHMANSGFLYNNDSVRPATANIESSPLAVRDKILELRKEIYKECGENFKQVLVQMNKINGKIKIDFEFDNPNRWKISPSQYKEMQKKLKPDFS